MRRHTDYENMVAAYDGLSPAERRELDTHLVECSACATDLAAYRQMDNAIRSARSLKASAGLRVRFNEAMDAAAPSPAPELKHRPVIQEPVLRQTKRPRAPWTWSRLLVPAGFVLLFVAAIALSLSSSGRNDRVTSPSVAAPQHAPAQQAPMVELTFACDVMAAYNNYTEWGKVIAAFEADNPDVTVRFTPETITGSDAASYHQGMADLAARTDVFCTLPGLDDLQAGTVVDLASYIANDPTFRPDDFYPGLLATLNENDAIVSIPTYVKPMFISYDPAAFDAAGLAHPQPGWTWDDFLAAAVALTQRSGDEVTRWGYYETGLGVFSGRLLAAWDTDLGLPPDYRAMEGVLGWYAKMYAEHRAANLSPYLSLIEGGTAPEEVSGRSLELLLAAGKVAMWEAGWLSGKDEPRHLATYPGPYSSAHFGRVGGLVMSGRTANPDQAWRFISYLSQHLPDGELPARRSLAERASFWQDLDASSTAAYRYMLDHLEAAPYADLPAESVLYQRAAIAVAKGEKTVEQALADLHAQVKLRGGP